MRAPLYNLQPYGLGICCLSHIKTGNHSATLINTGMSDDVPKWMLEAKQDSY